MPKMSGSQGVRLWYHHKAWVITFANDDAILMKADDGSIWAGYRYVWEQDVAPEAKPLLEPEAKRLPRSVTAPV